MTGIYDGFSVCDYLKSLNDVFSYERICQWDADTKTQYRKLLDRFKEVHEAESDASNAEKGRILEDLASYLIEHTGNLFKITRNLKTTTNEIDIRIELTPAGKILCAQKIICENYNDFICECKNYSNKVGVTYVGKFCSLLLSTSCKLGIFFSYHGVSGEDWKDASGLIKKLYLSRERSEDRVCIIDFNINDFDKICDGSNLLQIIEDKMKALQYDVDYMQYVQSHELEGKL